MKWCRWRSRSDAKVVRTGVRLVIGVITGFMCGTFLHLHGLNASQSCRSHPARLGGDGSVETVGKETRPDNFIYVGVMTAKMYMSTRASAVSRTWAKAIPGKVTLFSGVGDSNLSSLGMPSVTLPVADDTYPPLKKAFLMLKYMHDNYLERYEWFVRADDDVYIKGDKLEEFLRSVNSSEAHYIGHPGLGDSEEPDSLYLAPGENYCIGGPGVIVSRETLRRLAPHIGHCLRSVYTPHDDVEIGRCIRKFARVNCTWSYEMRHLFYQNYSTRDAFKGNIRLPEVYRAISLHPIKTTRNLYRIHSYALSKKIDDLNFQVARNKKEIEEMEIVLAMKRSSGVEDFEAAAARYKARFYTDVIRWEFLSPLSYSSWVEDRQKRSLPRSRQSEIGSLMSLIAETGRMNFTTGKILYGYRQVNPRIGSSYVIRPHLQEMMKRANANHMIRQHLYLRRPFGKVEFREDASRTYTFGKVPQLANRAGDIEETEYGANTIHFVVPLSGRFEIFQAFMKNFDEVCLKSKEDVTLAVVVFADPTHDGPTKDKYSELVKLYQTNNPDVDIRLIFAAGNFSRGVALELGAAEYPDDALLMFLDVDLDFGPDFLLRCRESTIKGKQVYYPIMFTQFNPNLLLGASRGTRSSKSTFVPSSDSGFFIDYSYGMVCAYYSDIKRVGGFDLGIVGWGLEDVDLYEKFISGNLTIFRGRDVSLIHRYHEKYCDPQLSATQYEMCLGSKSLITAGSAQLSKLVLLGRAQKTQQRQA